MTYDEGRVPSLFSVPLVLFFVALFLFMALLKDQRGLTLWALLVFCVAGGCMVWSRMSLSGLRCLAAVDRDRVFPEEGFTLTLSAENAKFLPVWLKLTMSTGGPILSASEEEADFIRETGLLWYQRAGFKWDLKAKKRGVHPIGPPHLSAGDLLGFFPRERPPEEALEVVVYPRLIPLKPFDLPKRDLFGVPGAASPVADPVYILGTRDYQYSQPARFIHWKASARHGRLQEKVFEPSTQAKVLFLIDVRGFAGQGAEDAFERTLEVAASLAVRMDRQGYALGLATNGLTVGDGPAMLHVARNPQKLPAFLECLARLKMETRDHPDHWPHQGLRLPWGVSAVHFSFEAGETIRPAETFLKHHKIPVLFMFARSGGQTGEKEGRTGERSIALDDICLEVHQ